MSDEKQAPEQGEQAPIVITLGSQKELDALIAMLTLALSAIKREPDAMQAAFAWLTWPGHRESVKSVLHNVHTVMHASTGEPCMHGADSGMVWDDSAEELSN